MVIGADPWAAYKNSERNSERNPWTKYQEDHPWTPADVSNGNESDPFSSIAAGALSVLIGKGIGAAFADGGTVSAFGRRPKTEKQARAMREEAQRLADNGKSLYLANGGRTDAEPDGSFTKQALAALALAHQVATVLTPEQAQDPSNVSWMCKQLLENSDVEEQAGWIQQLIESYESNPSPFGTAFRYLMSADSQGTGESAEPVEQGFANGQRPEVRMAFGGNVGIALGAATDEMDKQRKLKSDEAWNDARLKLVQPQLNTLGEQEENYRTTLGADTAQKKATIGLLPMQTDNKRLELLNSGADETDKAYGRLNQHFADRDYEGATGLANSLNLPQFGGSKVSSFTHNPTAGATATLDDGRNVIIPQASLDRGTQALNGGFKFFQDKNTGDIVKTNEKTGLASIASPGTGAGSRLTLPQQRTNAEIDDARGAIQGLSPEEIRRRTAKMTDTGRENPDYDPLLHRQYTLANTLKYGEQTRGQGQPSPAPAQPQVQTNAVAAKFSSDPKTSGYRLGTKVVTYRENGQTVQGYEVFDANGNPKGFYR